MNEQEALEKIFNLTHESTARSDFQIRQEVHAVANRAINKAKVIDLVNEAELNETIDISELNPYWKDISFDFSKTAEKMHGAGYCWTAHSKSSPWISTFPMQSAHIVKLFKTLKGAKRNFLRRL